MRIFFTLLRRELAAFFFSLTGYIIIAGVTLVVGSAFVMFIHNIGTQPVSMPMTELFFNSQLFWIVLMLVAPVITITCS